MRLRTAGAPMTRLAILIALLDVLAALLAIALWRLGQPIRPPAATREFRARTTIFSGDRRMSV